MNNTTSSSFKTLLLPTFLSEMANYQIVDDNARSHINFAITPCVWENGLPPLQPLNMKEVKSKKQSFKTKRKDIKSPIVRKTEKQQQDDNDLDELINRMKLSKPFIGRKMYKNATYPSDDYRISDNSNEYSNTSPPTREDGMFLSHRINPSLTTNITTDFCTIDMLKEEDRLERNFNKEKCDVQPKQPTRRISASSSF